MADTQRPAKAQLIELDSAFNLKSGGKVAVVQFNPETLKVSYANQIAQPNNAAASASTTSAASGASAAPSGDQSHQASRQFVGAGTTKLSLQLWFDVNAPLPQAKSGVIDVRELTKDVAYFITPQKSTEDANQFTPPAVRFVWGSFSFDGLVDSLDESLEYFSEDGLPLRASISLNMSQQKIVPFAGRSNDKNAPPPGVGAGPGTRPLLQASAGVSLQGLADAQGRADWQSIASANGIENPRSLPAGLLIDINLRR